MKTKQQTAILELVKVKTLSRWIDREDPKHPQFRFQLEIECEGRRMFALYSGGIAAFLTPAARRLIKIKADGSYDTGEYRAAHLMLAGKTLKDPEAGLQAIFRHSSVDPLGVIYSLVMDAQCGEYTFPDFCNNLGYEQDSRKAHKTWEDCQNIRADLKRVLGKHFDAAAEAVADY